ncbi:MAG: Fic family protein [Opitutaceae bacterium]
MNELASFYDNEAAMEPLIPTDQTGALKEVAARLIRASAKLAGALHPVTRRQVAELVRHMNSYYSNLIEGHHTHPMDIERALRSDFSKEPAKRALQLESAAHIEVEAIMETRLPDMESVNSDAFIQMLHREFYERMPEEFRIVKTSGAKIIPGEYRKSQVTVGAHIAPDFTALPRFMRRFSEAYDLTKLDPLERIIAAAASHHRFAWIHPFQDGNGRVVRLFSNAYLSKAGIESGGLWTISRGLARNVQTYREMLARADYPRQGGLDGRGNLSNRELAGFCTFFLSKALDQVEFMASLLELDAMQDRIMRYASHMRTMEDAPVGLGALMREAFMRGSVPRGDAQRLLEMPERTARRHVSACIKKGWIASESSLAPLTLNYSIGKVGYLFPKLYPEHVELSEP